MARSYDLASVQLGILPMRLDAITIRGGPDTQRSGLDQGNFNNQVDGECLRTGCAQPSRSSRSITDVIKGNRRLFKLFGS